MKLLDSPKSCHDRRWRMFCGDRLCPVWGAWLRAHPSVERWQGGRLFVGAGINVGQEGRKLPGVKGAQNGSL